MANLKTNNLSGEGGRNAIRGSVQFNGGNDALAIPASSDFAYGTGDFTIEAWIWKNGNPVTGQTRGIYTQTQSGNDYIVFKVGSTNNIQVTFGGTTISTTEKIAVLSWNHVAVSRSSNTVKVFVNGIASSGSTVSTDFSDTTRNPTIGNYTHSYGSLPFYGYISNLRVTKGEALYTADFTPPTTELTAGANTVLLCCQDSDDATQEATGKTITGKGRYAALSGELFTDPGFNTTNAWTGTGSGGWTTTGNGVATHAQGTAGNLYQDVSNLDTSATYKLSVDVVTSDNDVAYFYVEGYTSDGTTNYQTLGNRSNATVGHYEMYFTPTATTREIGFRGSSLFAGTITNLKLEVYEYPLAPKLIPPVGIDDGITFDGAISMNSTSWMYFPTGRTEERGRGRGVFSGGRNTTRFEFINIQSQGNSQTFGDSVTGDGIEGFAVGSSTRGLFAGGYPSVTNVIEFITFATESKGTDFGDMTTERRSGAGVGNETRGLFGGGLTEGGSTLNTIEFSTIASLGDSTNFGDLTEIRDQLAGFGDTTRGIWAGGKQQQSPSPEYNIIDYVTIATTGDAQNFGDLSSTTTGSSGGSDSTRGVIALGHDSPNYINTIEFITIQTTGDATDFGDSTSARYLSACMSNSIRVVWAGGGSPSGINTIDFVTIQTTGNAIDFGDLDSGANFVMVGTSDSHGGL